MCVRLNDPVYCIYIYIYIIHLGETVGKVEFLCEEASTALAVCVFIGHITHIRSYSWL